jgi:hypothetical protein
MRSAIGSRESNAHTMSADAKVASRGLSLRTGLVGGSSTLLDPRLLDLRENAGCSLLTRLSLSVLSQTQRAKIRYSGPVPSSLGT